MRIRLSARYQWEDINSPPFFDQTFTGPRITIGNSPAANLSLNGMIRSGEQIVILFDETEPQIINQAEGASLNGELLDLNFSTPLRHGDLLAIGGYQISIAFDDEPSSSDVEPAIENDLSSLAKRNGENHSSKQPKSFAAILDSLRTDEDRFYFVIEDGPQASNRIPIELEQMPLGWDETGQQLGFEVSSIAHLCAVVQKDWSGVILRTQTGFDIRINGEPLEDERRLRDGDQLLLTPPDNGIASNTQFVLTFHEPTSLVILDSVMPRVLPEENAAPPVENNAISGVERAGLQTPVRKLAALIKSDKEYFTAFTFVELSLMAIGTIVGAIIIFLFLTYS